MNTELATVKVPGACTGPELDDFVALVLAGGEVTSVGLPKRVRDAHSLSFLRSNGCLIGVAGLKFPSDHHRTEIESRAGTPLASADYSLELGWVFVLPSARGGKSYALCAPLIGASEGKGIFATSRSKNTAMHVTLGKLGFSRVGGEWPSGQNPDSLWLFLKNAANPSLEATPTGRPPQLKR